MDLNHVRQKVCQFRKIVLCVALAAGAGLCTAGPAHALSGKSIRVGEPLTNEPPSVAVDASGTAYIAWNDDKDVADAPSFVQYCVLPAGASTCRAKGDLMVPDSAQGIISNVQVLVSGSTESILVSDGYDELNEWQSTDGGSSWALLDNGFSLANVSTGDRFDVGAVLVPGTGELGFDWTYVGGPPTFQAFPVSDPSPCPAVGDCAFATLQPASNPDQVSNNDGEVGSSTGSDPGVLAVYTTEASNGPLGCPVGDGLVYAYGSGDESPTNSYSISPGSPDSAWKVPVTLAECDTSVLGDLAVGGGPGGLGIIGRDEPGGFTFYQPFDQTTMSFGKQIPIMPDGESDPSLSQNGHGELYTTFFDYETGKIELAVSTDSGHSWSEPGTLSTGSGEQNVDSSVNAGGQGWVAWTDNGSVDAQQFDAADAGSSTGAGTGAGAGQPPTVSGGGTATSTGSSVTITVHCSAACTISVTVTSSGAAAQIARVSGAERGKVTLAAAKVKLSHAGTRKIALHLTRRGRALLRRHRRLNAELTLSQHVGGHVITHTRTLHITAGHSRLHKG